MKKNSSIFANRSTPFLSKKETVREKDNFISNLLIRQREEIFKDFSLKECPICKTHINASKLQQHLYSHSENNHTIKDKRLIEESKSVCRICGKVVDEDVLSHIKKCHLKTTNSNNHEISNQKDLHDNNEYKLPKKINNTNNCSSDRECKKIYIKNQDNIKIKPKVKKGIYVDSIPIDLDRTSEQFLFEKKLARECPICNAHVKIDRFREHLNTHKYSGPQFPDSNLSCTPSQKKSDDEREE